ncbi:GNAT family N-acetyltransferase [Caloranaerobacter ferrireducens]|uniref:GNAT family N-acetyltransferase n=1 Tax=Caloranaerobacter ferrireducens TaxID=1323370 RepID=UPI00084D36C3|nr:GNAT family N-acetyltransferase [Caloranaerobacter ferrireducens]
MVSIESIKESELDDLSLLYEELTCKKSDMDKIYNVFSTIKNNPNYFLLGVKYYNKLIGSAMAIICNDLTGECRPFMVVENVIIKKEFRQKGFGKKLFEHIENIAKRHNCYFIMFVSNIKRVGSHKFYEKLGYNSKNNLAFKKYL